MYPETPSSCTYLMYFSMFEVGHAITSIYALYQTTITFYGHPERLVKVPDSLNFTVLFEGLITILVQVGIVPSLFISTI
jgi:hypothetical protein